MIEHFYKFLQSAKRCKISTGEQVALQQTGLALQLILSDDDPYEGWNQLMIIAEAQVKQLVEEADIASFDETFGD